MVVGALGGALGGLYALGGGVMWLRFHEAGLPADDAVALVPKADLVVIGVRVLVLPALAMGVVLLAMASIRLGREREFAELSSERMGTDAESERAAAIDTRLDALRERPRPLDALPVPLRRPVRVALASIAIVLVLIVPFSPGALAWPVAGVALVLYWLRLRRTAPIGSGRRFPIWRAVVAGVVAAAVISIARQTDPPVQLSSVQVFVSGMPQLVRAVGTTPSKDARGLNVINGVLVTQDDRQVSVGDPLQHEIVSIPRADVASTIIGPPLDTRAPPPSLLSRILKGDEWAVTPLEIWCQHLRFNWSHVADVCKGTPSVAAGPLRFSSQQVPIVVSCPVRGPGPCRGYLVLQFLDPTGDGSPLFQSPPVAYSILPGNSKTINVLADATKLVASVGGRMDVHVVLALTPTMDGVLASDHRTLALPVKKKKKGGTANQGPGGQTTTGSGTSTGSGGGGSPQAPKPSAPTATVTPPPQSTPEPGASGPVAPPTDAVELAPTPTP